MIQISTSADGRRHILLPRALADVARELFDDDDLETAVFRLARSLTGHDLHSVENIALHSGHAEAVKFAKQRQVGKSALA